MARSDSHDRTIAINSNPLVARCILPILWHIVGCHQKKQSGSLLEPASCVKRTLESSRPRGPTRATSRVTDLSSMRRQPLATDNDTTTEVTDEVVGTGLSELIESPDRFDLDRLVPVEAIP
jgi:hypothetical protein